MMMTAEKFNSCSKADHNRIYCELCQKLEEKDSPIADHVVTVSEFLKNSSQVTTTSAIITPTINTSAKNDVFIRKFETLKVKEKTESFSIGSSILTPGKRSDNSSGLQYTCVSRLDDKGKTAITTWL